MSDGNWAPDSSRRRPTRNDVARLAGVSSAVVSYVINGGPRPVAAETKERVLDAIDKLGYRPNAAARALTTGQDSMVGVIFPDLANPYFGVLAHHLERLGRQRGLVMSFGQGRADSAFAGVEPFVTHGVRGIISVSRLSAAPLEMIIRAGIPLVYLSVPMLPEGFSGVMPDYFEGSAEITRHLADFHGHQRIGMVMGANPGDPHYTDARMAGWVQTMSERGLDASAVVRTDWSAGEAKRAVRHLMASHPDLTGIVVSSDGEAQGVLAGLDEMGLRVGEDIAVVSFDATPQCEFMIPPLTSAGASAETMAELVLRQLLDGERGREIVPPRLVIRRSCGCS